jgi:excisionase family DNA binding protein|tara:strand:- start:99 stop:293 length:195 start_codon:yes stop_codon:yes gene_type:complete
MDEYYNHPLMTLEEASRELRLSKNTLNNWLSQGKIKRVKIGRKTFLDRKEVEGILAAALGQIDP